ncbi:hypothetical protein [Ideonella sp.]|uniref:hypothetical protein n=1 Tax=Ideonella sp. TaxID=1929293 RepID=UPI002B49F5FB|nr:hypothetical protein [Ideonella sp.]HJV71346.1 hypothetical protein [Ideonella sp.]
MIASREVVDGLKQGVLVGAAVLVLVLPQVRQHAWRAPAGMSPTVASALQAPAPEAGSPPDGTQATPAPPLQRRLELGRERASRDVRRVAQWVVDAADNGDRQFVILDKRNARVYVFEPSGKLAGASPVLLGYAAGDDTVPGIGERPIEDVRPQERTTPAGRFVAERGRNARDEDVVWVDYDAAVSMHRVLTTNPVERRLQRLASPTSRDNRISYGCINLPPSFFEKVLWPRFEQRTGVVYVLPEVKPLAEVFPGVARPLQLARKPGVSGPHVSGV